MLDGEFYYGNSTQDNAIRLLYSTDASVYQEKPMAVAIPKSIEDIKKLIQIAREKGTTLIPRAAGTSLAGQVVGNGIVVDISKYFTKIIELNQAEKWVRVQPGVIRDDLNAYLKPYDLLFGPETSTANRAMIGGMIGNNSCGLHSIVWGTTRDNLLEIKGLLSDGSEVIFKDFDEDELNEKSKQNNLEGKIYSELNKLLSNPDNQKAIREGFPKPNVTRRNTGYALDAISPLIESSNRPDGGTQSLGKLLAGSEGTLCFITEAKLKLIDLPPKEVALVCVHTHTMEEMTKANLIALKHNCYASELIDDVVLSFTKDNIEQSKNRDFVEGSPKAILMVEFFDDSLEVLNKKAEKFINDLKIKDLGYAYPIIYGIECKKAWDLRKAGLGLLSNQLGDLQPVNLIEDFAVSPEDQPEYIRELEALLKKHNLTYSMSAHAGAGEIHVVPMMNLKSSEGRQLFRTVLAEAVELVKKYGGSLSGEHGDGRLRGEFIPTMMGEKNYELFKQVKHIFDPDGVFNRGKITETPPMNEFLRFGEDEPKQEFNTVFDFTKDESILRLAEKCGGSGDCRKTEITGGTMCPSYMATRSERDTTRARANILRHYYTAQAPQPPMGEFSVLDDKRVPPSGVRGLVGLGEAVDVLDLCLSCKACKSECPSGVDVAKMKAEFMQEYYDKNGVPFRSRLIANFSKQMKLASIAPFAYNFIVKNDFLRRKFSEIVGFHSERSMPNLEVFKNKKATIKSDKKVHLFLDEFTKYNEGSIGTKAIKLLGKLGYEVIIPKHLESGRTYLSKGLVREAQKIAIRNVELLKDLISDENPIIGIEPSAILTLRDEYLDLVPSNLKATAEKIAKNTFTFEEWLAREIDRKNIDKSVFNDEKRLVKVHGHCYQKALSSMTPSKKILSLPANYEVQMIPSGCCGMAGSFGYEKEHYEISMKIGELVLFPTVRKQAEDVIIAAAGTSCRHQIKDGTGRIAKHPVEILFDALK